MRVSLVVAAARNDVIGHERAIPWRLPDDQKFFRRVTMGHVLVYGRKTFDEIGKALPGRRNFVLTRSPHDPVDDVDFFPDLAAALAAARETGETECFVAGGEAIYREAMTLADRLYVTRVDAEPEGDTHFPEIDESQWKRVAADPHEPDERHAHAFVFETWERRD